MRLGLKYPAERVPLSWDFSQELNGAAPKSVRIDAVLARGSHISDAAPESILDKAVSWCEDGIVFQLIQGGIPGADYKITATIETQDGTIYQKISVLPVRDE